MHILILGGSPDTPGGVEAFCERATGALTEHGFTVSRGYTHTAYLTMRDFPKLLLDVAALSRFRRNRPDCVWLQYHNFPDLLFLLIARLFGMKVMVTPHLGANWRSQANPVLRRLSAALLSLAGRIALISRTQEQEIRLPRDVPRSMIATFLPKEVIRGDLPDVIEAPSLRIVHSGRLSVGKGSFQVVEICALLRDAAVPFTARIIGGAAEADYARLNALIAEHALGDHVTVLRWLPVTELLEHMRNADVLIHPSVIDSYPLIVLEAMACGMIPVCVDLAGARNMIETYDGHVVDARTAVPDVAGWLLRQDVVALRRRGHAAAARVRADYAWERCSAFLETSLESCIRGDVTTYTDAVGTPQDVTTS